MKNILLAVTMVSILTGCGLFGTQEPEQIIVKKIVVVKVDVPGSLLSPCIPEKPLAKDKYLALKPIEREQYLTDYSVTLLGVVSQCNAKLRGVKNIVDQTNQIKEPSDGS